MRTRPRTCAAAPRACRTGQAAGRAANLGAAPHPRTPERTLNLGVSPLAQFRRRGTQANLDRALALFEGTAQITISRIERASALNSQTNALPLRFEAPLAAVD